MLVCFLQFWYSKKISRITLLLLSLSLSLSLSFFLSPSLHLLSLLLSLLSLSLYLSVSIPNLFTSKLPQESAAQPATIFLLLCTPHKSSELVSCQPCLMLFAQATQPPTPQRRAWLFSHFALVGFSATQANSFHKACQACFDHWQRHRIPKSLAQAMSAQTCSLVVPLRRRKPLQHCNLLDIHHPLLGRQVEAVGTSGMGNARRVSRGEVQPRC